MKCKLFIIFLPVMLVCRAFSQEDSAFLNKNFLHLEVGGIGGYGSVNYERTIAIKSKMTFAVAVGLSTYHFKDFANKFNPDILIPLSIRGYYGKDHKVEFGVGQVFSNIVHFNFADYQAKREVDLHSNFSIGYRYQKKSSRLVLRCMYTPIIEFNRYFRHWAGVSFGYSF